MAGCTIGCHFLVCSVVGCFPPVVQKLAYNCIHSRRGLSGMLVRRGRTTVQPRMRRVSRVIVEKRMNVPLMETAYRPL